MPPAANKKRKANDGASIATGTGRSTRSQKPLLSIEMIGKVGSFANYDNGDLMNICLAVGPTDARIIRNVCLRNNDEYLERITGKTLAAARNLSKAKEELSAWMEINTDWRGVKCNAEAVNGGAYYEASFDGVDGKKIMRTDPMFLFNNPLVAIELGMLDLLKYQVEVIGIDINALRWSGYIISATKANILLVAACHDRACFDYLLSREDLDVGAPIIAESPNTRLWQYAVFESNISAEIVQFLVRHPSFPLNQSFTLGENVLLPLHIACSSCFAQYGSDGHSQRVAKVKILLDAGADPLLTAPSAPSSIELVTGIQARYNEETEKVQLCRDLIDMMEEKLR